MTQFHKHHIVPKYKCKELGINPEFEDNYCYPTRHQHALIHWGYKCNDLKPLLEVCNPPQWVIDMIPIGDNRDAGAAVLTARGEIDGIDISGENSPAYKHGMLLDTRRWKKLQVEGRLDELTQEERDKWNTLHREYKREKNKKNDAYSLREKERKKNNHHRWPSTIKKKEEQLAKKLRKCVGK